MMRAAFRYALGNAPSSSAVSYARVTSDDSDQAWLTTAAATNMHREVMRISGVFRRLRVRVATAPGAGKSWTFEVLVNGTTAGLTTVIADTATEASCDDFAEEVSFNAGDYVLMRATPSGTPTATASVYWVVELGNDEDGECHYAGTFGLAADSSTVFNNGPFQGSNDGNSDPQALITNHAGNVMAVAGTITGWTGWLEAAASGGYAIVIYKNGVAQNGSGGTPDTRISGMTAALTSYDSSAFSLSVAEGDYLHVASTGSTPTARRVSWSVKFVAEGDEFPVFHNDFSYTTQVTRYYNASDYPGNTATETTANNMTPISATGGDVFELRRMRVRETVAPGTTAVRTFTVRKNAASQTPVVALVGSADTGSDLVNTASMVAGDVWNVMTVNTVANHAANSEQGVGWAGWMTPEIPPQTSQASLWRTDTGSTENGTAYYAFLRTRPTSLGALLHKFGVMAVAIVARAADGVEARVRLIRDHTVEPPIGRTVGLSPAGSESHVIRRLDSLGIRELRTLQFEIRDMPTPSGRWEFDTIAARLKGEEQAQ